MILSGKSKVSSSELVQHSCLHTTISNEERSMKGSPATSADKLLTSLSTTYQESIEKNGGVDAAEELDDGDAVGLDTDESADCENEDEARSSGRSETIATKISKKKRNPLMGKDIYSIGRELLKEKDIVAVRAEAEFRRQKKSSVRACIMQSISNMVNGFLFKMPIHNMTLPSWQKYVRDKPNNLGIN